VKTPVDEIFGEIDHHGSSERLDGTTTTTTKAQK
jgi:hypothetical protein